MDDDGRVKLHTYIKTTWAWAWATGKARQGKGTMGMGQQMGIRIVGICGRDAYSKYHAIAIATICKLRL
jgi:hypothetical protein